MQNHLRLVVLCSLGLLGCSKVHFQDTPLSSSSSSSAQSSVSSNADGSVGVSITQPGTPTPTTPVATPAVLPRLHFSSPPCTRQSLCEMDFSLSDGAGGVVEFDWVTNDQAYLTPHTPPNGQPHVHYVPTGGHVTFAPGQSLAKGFVQNINPYTTEINIAALIMNCTYQGAAYPCTALLQ